jgi:hypothetical protein
VSALRWKPALVVFRALLVACALVVHDDGVPATANTGGSNALLTVAKRLASPEWEGRGIGTGGIDSAAAYIESLMRAHDLAPGGEDGTYFQSLDVTTGVTVGEPTAIQAGAESFPAGDQFQPLGFSSNGTLTAPVVFAGYGITAPGFEYDDYAGLDVRDKLVLVLAQEPGEMDSTSRFNGNVNTAHAELRTKAINAREHGALGMLIVNGPRYHSGEPIRRPRSDGAGYVTSGILAAQISETIAERLLRGSGATLAGLQKTIDDHTRPGSMALPDSVKLTVTLKRTRATTRNVVGWITGRDTSRTIVIGAHYDHLGYGGESSLTPDSREPHVGADDNASGTAVVLEVARTLAARRRPPVHNLVFCAFTGEESGLLGSSRFVDGPTRPLETIEAMINLDMVGRLRDGKLMVMGAGTAVEFPGLLESANRARTRSNGAFDLRTSSDGYGPSDHTSFYKRNVPVLALFTGVHTDYHKPSDTPEKLNPAGMSQIADFVVALVESLDARPRVTYQKAKADSTVGRIAGGGGYGAWLGTIPDYMQTEGGVLLSGIRSGSPAEKAGLEQGDTIVKFDGVRIDNIYDYTYALRSRKPGQQVRITVRRGSAEQDLMATLGRRP